jgi:hypothetical protein
MTSGATLKSASGEDVAASGADDDDDNDDNNDDAVATAMEKPTGDPNPSSPWIRLVGTLWTGGVLAISFLTHFPAAVAANTIFEGAAARVIIVTSEADETALVEDPTAALPHLAFGAARGTGVYKMVEDVYNRATPGKCDRMTRV